ncbi:MAG: hypothetical protein FWB75_05885 [Oscillospiraceae bacterium]|nr:hypothetical protein [Oscillospiraceae bacterium]
MGIIRKDWPLFMTIKVNRPENMEALYSRCKRDAEANGIAVTGDMHKGSAKGFGFEGSYVVDENFITITLAKKPPFISKSRIEKEISNYLR